MAYYYRGKAYMQMGMKDEACGDYRKALELGYYVVDQFAVDLCGL
jgi:Flp pilus assembly protein TadD